MVKLTDALIKTRLKTDSLTNIKKLNLWGCDIDDISVLASLPSLEILSLSVNKITSLKPLQYLVNLRECYLRKNDIEDIAEAEYLRDLTKLRVLWLDDNPVAFNDANYRKRVIQICPFLTTLDNRFVTKDELNEAVPGYVRPPTPPPEPHPDQRRLSYAEPDPPATARTIIGVAENISSSMTSPTITSPIAIPIGKKAPIGEVGFYAPGVMSQSLSQSFGGSPVPPPPQVGNLMTGSYHPALQHQHSTPEHHSQGQMVHVIPQGMTQSYHPAANYVYQPQPQPVPVPVQGQVFMQSQGGEMYQPQPPPNLMSQSLYGSLPNTGFHQAPVKYVQAAPPPRDCTTPQPDNEDSWLSFDEDEKDEAGDKPSVLVDSFSSRFGVRRSLTRARQNRSRSASPSRLQRQENVLTAILHLMDDLDVEGLRVLIDQAHERIKKMR